MGFTQCFDLMWIIVYVVVTDNGDDLHWLPGGALMRFYEAISGNAMHGLTMAVGLARSPLTVGFARTHLSGSGPRFDLSYYQKFHLPMNF